MHKVMGGEFKIEEKLLQETKDDKLNIPYSSGRTALFTILNNEKIMRGGGTILIPDYVCDSVTRTIKEAGWNYVFYRINDDLKFNAEEIGKYENIDSVLVVNYFGMINLEGEINNIKTINPNIIVIEDDVQAFFKYKESKADYSFTSLRKWFPCLDGALINTKIQLKDGPIDDSKWSQYKLAGNILKNYENIIDDSIYLELLKKGEELLENEYYSLCSEVSRKIFSNINLDEIAYRRKINAKYLHEELCKLGVKHIYQHDAIPLFIPIFIDNRNLLRKEFFKDNIFVPVHWPKTSDELNGMNVIYDRELSLICDQRYGIEDMKRQIEVLKQFLDSEGIYCGSIYY